MTCNILVQVWCEIDPTINVRIDRQSGVPHAEPGDVLLRVSPWGRANVAAALSIENAEVTAVACGTGHVEALRHALAAGAGSAIELVQSSHASSTFQVGVLAEWSRHRDIDLFIGDRTIGCLAGRLGWAHLAGVGGLTIHSERLHAIRYLERGAREEVTASLPASVVLCADTIRPPYVSRGRIGEVPLDQIQREEIRSSDETPTAEIGPLQQKRERTRAGQTTRSTSSRGADRLASLMQPGSAAAKSQTTASAEEPQSAEELAEQFVRYLRHHDLLRGGD